MRLLFVWENSMLICNKYAILELCNLVVSNRKNNNRCGKISTRDNAYVIHTRYLEQVRNYILALKLYCLCDREK